MTFAEGLLFWPCIFGLFAGAVAFLRRGAFYVMVKPEPEFTERRRAAVRHVNAIGYRYLAASLTTMLFVAIFLSMVRI